MATISLSLVVLIFPFFLFKRTNKASTYVAFLLHSKECVRIIQIIIPISWLMGQGPSHLRCGNILDGGVHVQNTQGSGYQDSFVCQIVQELSTMGSMLLSAKALYVASFA